MQIRPVPLCRSAGCLIVLAFANMFLLHMQAFAAPGKERGGNVGPLAIPTFNCLGLYWSPPGGGADQEVLVKFRPQGAPRWQEGLPMRYNPIDKTEEDLADYRGSIVYLAPATTYEIQLTLAGTSTSTNFTARTWSEDFPTGEKVAVKDRNTPLVVTESGTA